MIVKQDGGHIFYSGESPKNGAVVMAFKGDAVEQCEYRDGTFYVWLYGITPNVWGNDKDITMWRGCTGFDF